MTGSPRCSRPHQTLSLPNKSSSRAIALKICHLIFFQCLVLQHLSSMATSRWIRPEIYPLFAAMGVAVGICGFQLIRNITTNPEVRVNKEGRAAGVLENFEEGKKYSEHSLRKLVRNRKPEIMPSVNSFFSDPQRS